MHLLSGNGLSTLKINIPLKMQGILLTVLVCVLASCCITNVSHVAGTLSKKDKKGKKNSEKSRTVSKSNVYLWWSNYVGVLKLSDLRKIGRCTGKHLIHRDREIATLQENRNNKLEAWYRLYFVYTLVANVRRNVLFIIFIAF